MTGKAEGFCRFERLDVDQHDGGSERRDASTSGENAWGSTNADTTGGSKPLPATLFDDSVDRAVAGPAKAASGHHRPSRAIPLDGWQVAGFVLLFVYLSPALITGTDGDWAEGLGAILLSSPLLAWLFAPLRRSDDMYDETNRRRAERIDTLALVLLWTWPLTCGVPLSAVVRWAQLFLLRQ